VRYTRHDLKQDKFAESAAEAVHEVVEHRSEIIRAIIALAVVGLILGGIFLYMQSRAETADVALGRAMATYNAPVVLPNTPPQGAMTTFHSDQERLIEAKNQFYAVSDKYGSTNAGKYAHYLAAMCEQELGNDKVAEQQLQSVARSRNGELAALAKYALAAVYRNEKREQDAINLLQGLVDKPTSSVPKAMAQLALADTYRAERQPEKAKVILDQIIRENPNNGLGDVAKSRQGGLK